MNSSDLVFILKAAPHPFYTRKDSFDLSAELEITLKEALLGFRK